MKKIGILAGSGALVEAIINGCVSQKNPFHIIAFHNQNVSPIVENHPHSWFHLGQVGAIIKQLKHQQCTHIVMAGRIERPNSWSDIKPDLKGALLLTRLVGKSMGDDGLFKTIISYLEDEGFEVIGCELLMSNDSFCDEGLLTITAPDNQAIKDIARGLDILRCLSLQDVGQSCIVQNGLVLGIEALEGTDNLIKRCQNLHESKEGGVLIKALKIGQDTRVDRATIGVNTIEHLSHCGFKGLAVQANGVILLNKQDVIAKANQCGLFIIGVEFDTTT